MKLVNRIHKTQTYTGPVMCTVYGGVLLSEQAQFVGLNTHDECFTMCVRCFPVGVSCFGIIVVGVMSDVTHC